jgi:beta-fructofuranosidase
VVVLYTGVQGERQLPCLARSVSDDLLAFKKDPDNPILSAPPTADVIAFRDPDVVRDAGRWRLLVGGGTRSLGGAVFSYVGDDLDNWRPDALLLDGSRASIPGEIWECPGLFVVGDTAVLIVSALNRGMPVTDPRPRVWYAAGALGSGRLEPARTDTVDDGDRFYAPQSYDTADGRRLMFGWICTHLDPAVTTSSERGLMAFPRELTVRNGRLRQRPARELRLLRGEPIISALPLKGGGGLDLPQPLTALELHICEGIVAAVELIDTSTGRCRTVAPREPADELTLYLDGGVIETFSGGRVATWTDLALTRVDRIEFQLRPGTDGEPRSTVWPLALPESTG